MFPNYEKLKTLVDGGDLEIVYVFSPPRTISTAVHIALTEIADGQIMEPFNEKRAASFNEGCGLILDRVRQLTVGKSIRPIRLVIKDLVKNFDFETWKLLWGLTKHSVFTIREPTAACYSLLAKRVGSLLFGVRSDQIASHDQVLEHANEVPREKLTDQSWSNLGSYLDWIEEGWGSGGFDGFNRLSIVSGLSLRLDPELTVRRLSERFGWTPFNRRLVSGWTRGSGKNFYATPFKGFKEVFVGSAWISEAVNSTGFKPLKLAEDGPRSFVVYPDFFKEYILKEVFPVYVRMLLHPLNDSRPPFDRLIAPVDGKLTLPDINPIEAYLLLSSYRGLEKNKEEKRQKMIAILGTKLKKEFPEIFSCLNFV